MAKIKTKPRDLSTVDAHLERAEAWSHDLWKANNLDIHRCDGSVEYRQSGVLSNIRNDIRVLLNLVKELK